MTALNWERAHQTWTPREIQYDTLVDQGVWPIRQQRNQASTYRKPVQMVNRECHFDELQRYVDAAKQRDYKRCPTVQRHEMQKCIYKLLARCQQYRPLLTGTEAALMEDANQVLRKLHH
jgi:hypothetical protein